MDGGQPYRLTAPPRQKLRAPKNFVLEEYRERERVAQVDCTNMLQGVLSDEVAWTAIDHGHSFNPTIGRNGRPIGIMEMVNRKARGVQRGIPDYFFGFHSYTYWIEFKVDDGVLSEDEKKFIRRLLAAGHFVKVCWGSVQVMNTVYGWGLCRPQVKWEVR
jgi:hypothetical protein